MAAAGKKRSGKTSPISETSTLIFKKNQKNINRTVAIFMGITFIIQQKSGLCPVLSHR